MSRGAPFWSDDEGQGRYNAICGAPPGESLVCVEEIPAHLHDLNAMHEAEKSLNAEQQMEYARHICEMVHSPRHWAHINFDITHATAAQRAEAFLKTIGKWVEDSEPVTA